MRMRHRRSDPRHLRPGEARSSAFLLAADGGCGHPGSGDRGRVRADGRRFRADLRRYTVARSACRRHPAGYAREPGKTSQHPQRSERRAAPAAGTAAARLTRALVWRAPASRGPGLPHRPPPAGAGSVVNRCGGGWSAGVAGAPSPLRRAASRVSFRSVMICHRVVVCPQASRPRAYIAPEADAEPH